MKVICIQQDQTCAYTGKKLVPELIVGNEYTIIDTLDVPDKGRYFKVAECDIRSWFNQVLFANIDPDLDETTLVNEEWEEKVCKPA